MKNTICHACNKPIPSDSPDRELCPACLLTQAMTTTQEIEETIFIESNGSSIEGLGEDSEIGPFVLVKQLGEGGMGKVFEANDTRSGRRVALKVLSKPFPDHSIRSRFLQEGRIAASINHANSVYIYQADEIDEIPIIVMELVEGGTLADKVKQNGPLPIHEAVDAILEVIGGLEEAQKVGILHRDIKPSNCFIDENGHVKIGDYGISISAEPRWERDLTQTGAILGTPAYSSPEQLRGDKLDLRSDIYSVGATLYYLLTGEIVFGADAPMKLILKVIEEPAQSPKLKCKDLPETLAKVILTCLNKNPADRFSSYADLRQQLLPFSSQDVLPASLSKRFGAFLCDLVVIISLLMIFLTFRYFDLDGVSLLYALVATSTLYYCLFESLGRTPGNTLFNLKFIKENGEKPGVISVLSHSVLMNMVPFLPGYIFIHFISSRQFSENFGMFFNLIDYAGIRLLFFITSIERNKYKGLHDMLVSVQLVEPKSNPKQKSISEVSVVEDVVQDDKIGDYALIKDLNSVSGKGKAYLAFDTVLFRYIWLTKREEFYYTIEPESWYVHKNCLRWISKTPKERESHWDVWENLDGAPLLSVLDGQRTWSAVKIWMADILSIEGNDIDIKLENLWLLPNGHLKVLPFQSFGINVNEVKLVNKRSCSLNEILKEILIQSGVSENNENPLHAQKIVKAVMNSESPEKIEQALIPQLERPSTVSLRQRVGLIAPAALILLFFGCLSLVSFFTPLSKKHTNFHDRDLRRGQSDTVTILNVLEKLQEDKNKPVMVEDLPTIKTVGDVIEVYLIGYYKESYQRNFIEKGWPELARILSFGFQHRVPAVIQEAGFLSDFERIMTMNREPTLDEVDFSDLYLKNVYGVSFPDHQGLSKTIRMRFWHFPYIDEDSWLRYRFKMAFSIVLVPMCMLALIAIFSSLIFNVNLTFLSTGTVIVGQEGRVVGRGVKALRNTLLFFPILVLLGNLIYVNWIYQGHYPWFSIIVACLMIIMFVSILIHSITEKLNILDKILGCRVVLK